MLPSLQHCIMGNLNSHTWHTRSPASSQGNTLMYSFHCTHPATAVVSSLSPHLVNYKSALEAENCFLSGDHTLTAGSNPPHPQRDAEHDEKTVFSFVCVSVTFLRVTRCCVYYWVRRYTFDTLRCACLCMYLKRLPSKINRNSNETAESEPPFLLFLFPLKQWLCMSWCVLSLFPFFPLQAKKLPTWNSGCLYQQRLDYSVGWCRVGQKPSEHQAVPILRCVCLKTWKICSVVAQISKCLSVLFNRWTFS